MRTSGIAAALAYCGARSRVCGSVRSLEQEAKARLSPARVAHRLRLGMSFLIQRGERSATCGRRRAPGGRGYNNSRKGQKTELCNYLHERLLPKIVRRW